MAELVTLAGRPWARMRWDAKVRTPEGEVIRGPVDLAPLEFNWQPPASAPRSLLGLDVGLVASGAAIGWEAGARYYPASWALSGRIGEVRAGFYGRVEGGGLETRAAAGASVLFGVGRQ